MSLPAAFRALVRKEVYHILRDRRTLFVVLAMPVVQMVLFGYALQTDVEEIRLLVVDPTPDVRTRAVVERFRAAKIAEFDGLRRRCARWAHDNDHRLRHADPVVPDSLNDRAQDNARALSRTGSGGGRRTRRCCWSRASAPGSRRRGAARRWW